MYFNVEMEGYSSAVEEIVVPDMHTRKKMFFERVRLILCALLSIGHR